MRLAAMHATIKIFSRAKHYGYRNSSATRALWDNKIAQCLKHYGIVG